MENATRMIEFIQANRGQLLQEWVEKMAAMDEQKLSTVITDQVYTNIGDEYINILVHDLINQDKHAKNKIRDFAQKMVQLGWNLNFIMDSLMEFSKIMFFHMVGEASEKEQIEFGWAYDKWVTPINKEVLNHYASSWQRTVSLQKIALQELSAPLIPIFDNITVMPLVGTIDTDRAKRIMENLLQGVVKHHAQVVLIDITGVPVVDTMVAHHIIQASEAVRLVGAKCLIVGIRPEIAQTIVNLGINLNQVVTKNSLQKGVAAALEMTNRKIVSVGE
ncbi:rsbT co-antagonist protein RsbR [Bacillus sp. SLBN-46]|uniref:STAS domain-containing protein n=1 Tax=Bacillus sp. SLBN-46 TaxID=3042283 RepID=UPI00285483BD|nr:STAS domain-containing protein [Bacillus sp. SLBN-46]MDR6121017.1 rsbT co-antagonist protein RsbR [Bacillus sp. SLBN-46]